MVKKISSGGRKNSESSDNSKLSAVISTPENVNNFDQDNIPTIKNVNNVVSQQGKSNNGSSSSLNKSPVKSNVRTILICNLEYTAKVIEFRNNDMKKISEAYRSIFRSIFNEKSLNL